MDKQKPTSGPWRVEVKASGSPGRVGIWAGNYFLASMGSFDHSHETIEANAKLMADAPRMLEVLRNLHDFALPLRCILLAAESQQAFADALSLLEKHGG